MAGEANGGGVLAGNPMVKSYGWRSFLNWHTDLARRKSKRKPHLRYVASGVWSGGAGNRTPVPWHFGVGLYVRILPLKFRP